MLGNVTRRGSARRRSALTTLGPSSCHVEVPSSSPQVTCQLEPCADNALAFSKDSSVYTRLAKAATQLGENLIALEIASEGSKSLELAFRQKYPEIVTSQQIDLAREQAIALSRLGSIREAQKILRDLLAIRAEDDKSLSALGRTYKDLAKFPGPGRKKFLERSRACYLQAYAVNGEYYPAINACTLSLWLNDRAAARRLAGEV